MKTKMTEKEEYIMFEIVREDIFEHAHVGRPYWHPALRLHKNNTGDPEEFFKFLEGEIRKERMKNYKPSQQHSERDLLLAMPTPAKVTSGTEARNIVCDVCWECFEHANSADHNNYYACLCDNCRNEIENGPDDNDIIEKLCTDLKNATIASGNVCADVINRRELK